MKVLELKSIAIELWANRIIFVNPWVIGYAIEKAIKKIFFFSSDTLIHNLHRVYHKNLLSNLNRFRKILRKSISTGSVPMQYQTYSRLINHSIVKQYLLILIYIQYTYTRYSTEFKDSERSESLSLKQRKTTVILHHIRKKTTNTSIYILTLHNPMRRFRLLSRDA